LFGSVHTEKHSVSDPLKTAPVLRPVVSRFQTDEGTESVYTNNSLWKPTFSTTFIELVALYNFLLLKAAALGTSIKDEAYTLDENEAEEILS